MGGKVSLVAEEDLEVTLHARLDLIILQVLNQCSMPAWCSSLAGLARPHPPVPKKEFWQPSMLSWLSWSPTTKQSLDLYRFYLEPVISKRDVKSTFIQTIQPFDNLLTRPSSPPSRIQLQWLPRKTRWSFPSSGVIPLPGSNILLILKSLLVGDSFFARLK